MVMSMVENTEPGMEKPLEVESLVPEGKVSFLDVMKQRRDRRAVLAVVPSLTLGIMGGAVLPVAWAFSVTGIICGLLIMLIVAAANTYTCDLLLKQAYATQTYDYETLALMIGGRKWKLVTEISIVILLLGTLIGQTAQMGEVGTIGLDAISPNLPNWLVGSSGRVFMVLGTVLIAAPLCLGKQLRQLEYAGVIGTSIVIWLLISVVFKSSREDLPAIRSKEFATVGFNNIGDVTQAVSIFGFAFYVQPIMMPLLVEVPDGIVGVKIVSYSMRIVVLFNAFIIYFLVGFFGAALYGQATESNILENEWLGGGVAQGILNLSMAVYLCLSVPVVEFPTRHTINGWLPETFMKDRAYARQLIITATILIFSLGMALAFPSSSGSVLVVTGATGVCMVSYLIPVVNHFLLYYNSSQIQKEVAETRIMPADMEGNRSIVDSRRTRLASYSVPRDPGVGPVMKNLSKNIILPGIVLSVGVFCSIAALTTL
ncbi:hypothetical protein MARPO_0194s0003 [Marchantia polymorpha]|uniref:Amino acid transporter transmembrane domain-containing protein n=1 Tax=Marchantia polymorpha TaxID=3197 RepID=A0A2R6W101_MARPO|nr:hypothetical protein MARPO_0194s0003 [Marchantia polymorpha]PTQ27522.1 hypothetical protein MARPO_0194s0003 [Marchantia polymorpha]PTQ27523.1 hypothetical protein MARPO_0194s0003 [Marchantia polymorpha]|eukprot:PTQ27521.1 hypothetical protein MARPO_0194s0003 [Marchantia polymorpha]